MVGAQRRRRGRHPLARLAAVAGVVGVAAAAAHPPRATADSTASYGGGGSRGSPPTCANPPVLVEVGLARASAADPATPTGSPFLVPNGGAYDSAMGMEDGDLYTPGGLHPVRLGDALGAYTVTEKLGWGTFSTVWRATHPVTGVGVAVKVWRSAPGYAAMAAEENEVLTELRGHDPAGDYPVMRLLDTFTATGAHGTHPVAVFELMGVSLRVALHAYLRRPASPKGRGAPVRVVARLARQVLEGLALAHFHRLLHTDLKLENVALRLPSAAEHAAAAAPYAATSTAPPEDAEAAAFWSPEGVPHSPWGRAAIIDWGNAERMGEDYVLPFSHQLQTETYRAPEAIAGTGASPGTDVWSVGVILYNMAAGDYLFRADEAAPWGAAVDHLALIADVLGAPDRGFPPWFRSSGAYGEELFDAPDPADPPGTPLRLKGVGGHEYTNLAALLERVIDWKDPVRAALADLLGAMLRIDPNERPTAAALLHHEFLTRAWTDEEVGVPPPVPDAAAGVTGDGATLATPPLPGGGAAAVAAAAGVAALSGA